MTKAISDEIQRAISLNRDYWNSDEPTTEQVYQSFMDLDCLLGVFRVAIDQGCEEYGIELSVVRAQILALFCVMTSSPALMLPWELTPMAFRIEPEGD